MIGMASSQGAGSSLSCHYRQSRLRSVQSQPVALPLKLVLNRKIPPSNGNVVMISAANAENIRIEGPGTIDGNGAKFFTGRGDMTGPGQNSSAGYYQRPHLLVFYRCQNLSMRDVFLTASAYHCVRLLQCQHLVLDGVRI